MATYHVPTDRGFAVKELDWLKGSITPLVTPIVDGDVDYSAYAALVENQIANGSHGVLVNGTTAEPSTLSIQERNRLVDIAVEVTHGRIPAVAATGSQSLADTRQLTQHAVRAGADALLIVTPYYVMPPQRGLVAYFNEVTRQVDVPWMLYHIPGRTGVSVTIDSLAKLRESNPFFVGMKHANNDPGLVTDCLSKLGDDFRIFVGLEELSFPMMAIGACGLMNAVGNIRPDALVALVESIWDEDLSRGRRIHQTLLEVNRSVFFDSNPIPIKYMMKKIGMIPDNEHRLPMVSASPELARRLDRIVERLDKISLT